MDIPDSSALQLPYLSPVAGVEVRILIVDTGVPEVEQQVLLDQALNQEAVVPNRPGVLQETDYSEILLGHL